MRTFVGDTLAYQVGQSYRMYLINKYRLVYQVGWNGDLFGKLAKIPLKPLDSMERVW